MGTFKYEVTYDISFCGGPTWEAKVMIVKNCDDKYNAESKLAKYLQKKYENVLTIKVLKCKCTNPAPVDLNSKKDIGKMFGDIFGEGFGNNIFDKGFGGNSMFGNKK